MEFLRGLEGNETFPIGAICAGPIYLAKAGLLKDKKFTNSMYLEMNERLHLSIWRIYGINQLWKMVM